VVEASLQAAAHVGFEAAALLTAALPIDGRQPDM